jgi:NitT/TauT family transport system permease protein
MSARLRAAAVTAGMQLGVLAAAVWLWWTFTDVLPEPGAVARAFSPAQAFPAFGELLGDGTLLGSAATSLWRLLSGLALAVVVGVPLGLLLGGVRRLERATGGLIQLLRMTSPLSWAPVAVLALGVGDRPVQALVAIAAVWPVALSTAAGVRALPADWLLAARALGATRAELVRSVVLPGVRPAVLTGVRLALGVAWIVLVPAEMLGVSSGLGYQVLNARDNLAYDELMAVILAIGILGFALDLLAQVALRPRRRRRAPQAAVRPVAAASAGVP